MTCERRESISVDQLEEVMRRIHRVIVSDVNGWIGSDRKQLKRKFLMARGMMYYWENIEKFEICNDFQKICHIIKLVLNDLITLNELK